MSRVVRYRTYSDYQVGWICATKVELIAAQAMLDEIHDDKPPKHPKDANSYVFGRIADHLVAIASLPTGIYGIAAAASVATNMKRSFPHISAYLMVGIGGGAPRYGCLSVMDRDIRLGDVVVSEPTSLSSGVFQYDIGKKMQGKERLQNVGTLNKASVEMRSAVTALKPRYELVANPIEDILHQMTEKNPGLGPEYKYQGVENDWLFEPDYHHHGEIGTCQECDKSRAICRPNRQTSAPQVHYGVIASGNQLMRDSMERDFWRDERDVICFEMEAAGLMDQISALVVRGICDYADSHKNDQWQAYAAAAAAAYAKDLLRQMQPTAQLASPFSSFQQADEELMRHFGVVDPEAERQRILSTRGKLHPDLCSWICKDHLYQDWLKSDSIVSTFWLHGDAGKGKTMIAMTVMADLAATLSSPSSDGIVAYFFCQQGEDRLNSVTSLLKGLIYELTKSSYHMLNILRKLKVTTTGAFRADAGASDLWRVLIAMINGAPSPVFLVVDALDECVTGLQEFLKLSEAIPPESQRLRWFLTSRNEERLQEFFGNAEGGFQLDLKLRSGMISKSVHRFVDLKIQELERHKGYNQGLKEKVREYLHRNAEDTFLWVALVCKELNETRKSRTEKILRQFPQGLETLYSHILEKVQSQSEMEDVKACEDILRASAIAFEPLHFDFLRWIRGPQEEALTREETIELINRCGSFLNILSDTVHIVHQSARDFILDKRRQWCSSEDIVDAHQHLGRISLNIISTLPSQDIAALHYPDSVGGRIDDKNTFLELTGHFKDEHPRPINYACRFWASHLDQTSLALNQSALDSIAKFFQVDLLRWMEALGLFGECDRILSSLALARRIVSAWNRAYPFHIHDAMRIATEFREIIRQYPLQVHFAPILFGPLESLTRQVYAAQRPSWLRVTTGTHQHWHNHMWTRKNDAGSVLALVFAPDGAIFASSFCRLSFPNVVLWNTATGDRIAEFVLGLGVVSLSFSPNATLLACANSTRYIEILSISANQVVQEIRSPEKLSIAHVQFICGGLEIVSGSEEGVVQVWNLATGTARISCASFSSPVVSIAFMNDESITVRHDGNMDYALDIKTGAVKNLSMCNKGESSIRARSQDGMFLVQAHPNQLCFHDLQTQQEWVMDTENFLDILHLELSPNAEMLACISSNGLRLISIGKSENRMVQLAGLDTKVECVAFSPGGTVLASGDASGRISMWDVKMSKTNSDEEIERFDPFSKLACSPDGKLVAKGWTADDVRLWNVSSGQEAVLIPENINERSNEWIRTLVFTTDSQLLAVGSGFRFWLWNVSSETPSLQTFFNCTGRLATGLFSPDDTLFAYKSSERIGVVDPKTGEELVFGTCSESGVQNPLAFSPSGQHLAFEDGEGTCCSISLWHTGTGETDGCIPTIPPNSISFSPDGKRIAAVSVKRSQISVWDIGSKELLVRFTDMNCDSVEFSRTGEMLITHDFTTERFWRLKRDANNESEFRTSLVQSLVTDEDEDGMKRVIGLRRFYFDFNWLMFAGRRVVWLPDQYQPLRCTSGGSTLATLNKGGRLMIMTLDIDEIINIVFPWYYPEPAASATLFEVAQNSLRRYQRSVNYIAISQGQKPNPRMSDY